MMIRSVMQAAACAAAIVAAMPAQATLVSYNFNAKTGFIYAGATLQEFNATLTYDPAAVQTGGTAIYSISNISLTVDGKSYTGIPGSSSGQSMVGESYVPYPFYPGTSYFAFSGLLDGGSYAARLSFGSDGRLGNQGNLGFVVNGLSNYVEYFGQGATVAAVPEAATWAMMLVGLGTIGAALRASKRRVRFSGLATA